MAVRFELTSRTERWSPSSAASSSRTIAFAAACSAAAGVRRRGDIGRIHSKVDLRDELLAASSREVGAPQRSALDEVALPLVHDPRHAQVVRRHAPVRVLTDDRVTLLRTKDVHRLGAVRATDSRLAATLAGHGLIERDPETYRYRLGFGLIRLARAAMSGLDLVRTAVRCWRTSRIGRARR
jgi:hypothetical protein